MDLFFVSIGLVLGLVLLLPLYRVFNGPTVFDRFLGAAAIGAKTLTLILLFGLIYDRLDMFVDISLGYAILNFIGVVAMAKYFRKERGSTQ